MHMLYNGREGSKIVEKSDVVCGSFQAKMFCHAISCGQAWEITDIFVETDPSTNLYTEEKKVYKTQWILNYTNISSEKGIQIPMVTMLYMMVTKLYKNPYGNQPIQISIVTNLYINPHFNQHKSQW